MNITLIGASGYAGAEFARLIAMHPEFHLKHVVSAGEQGDYTENYPNLLPAYPHLKIEEYNLSVLDEDTDAYVLALPHGVSMGFVKELYEKTTKKIVDLSGDFRYRDSTIYEVWYGIEHTAKDIPAVYGLCELNREQIRAARVVANPGCYTTCSILALAPLVEFQAIEGNSIIIDAKSGVTGAGRKCVPGTSFALTNDNARAYSIGTHRHTSEIEEQLSVLYGSPIALNFTPHLIPVNRGILATCYATLRKDQSQQQIYSLFDEFYQDSKFVYLLKDRLPEIKFAAGSNHVYLSITVDTRTNRVVVVSTLDNLIKGASGQAIENLNLMFGYPEEMGLTTAALYL